MGLKDSLAVARYLQLPSCDRVFVVAIRYSHGYQQNLLFPKRIRAFKNDANQNGSPKGSLSKWRPRRPSCCLNLNYNYCNFSFRVHEKPPNASLLTPQQAVDESPKEVIARERWRRWRGPRGDHGCSRTVVRFNHISLP